ncbi:LysR family transcriptional regulator [Aureimonas mangrovi]|uniref:LysR family transcriptional regulator n=1 Tax=Aureimonas mangrovi TaxID=2758041 RepID=UPI00163D74F3|nr:LysR family transcriptional regulator [Aureimonas mangrovi]
MRIEDALGFDLASLEIFVIVCETRSMAEAARKLGVTESAVSHSIRAMERKLGVSLFDRSFRPIKPTIMGLQLFERGRRLLVEASAITHDLRSVGHVAHAELRVGVIETMSTWFSAKLIQNLAASATSWHLTIASNDELWRRFEERELDIIVVIDDEGLRGDVEQSLLLTETAVLVTPASMDERSIEELAANEPLIGAHANSGFGRLTARYLHRLRVGRQVTSSMDTLEGVLIMVSLGFGWAILPSLLMLRDARERHLVRVRPLPAPGLRRRINLVMRHREIGQLSDVIRRQALRIIAAQIEETARLMPSLADVLDITLDRRH